MGNNIAPLPRIVRHKHAMFRAPRKQKGAILTLYEPMLEHKMAFDER